MQFYRSNCGYNWYCCDCALDTSTIGIVDIYNTNSEYRQLNYVEIHNRPTYCGYRQFDLSISTIRIADIDNSNCSFLVYHKVTVLLRQWTF